MRKVDPVKHEQKRRGILQAALSCFVRSGFHGASTTDICAAAKISPGHLYHYFPSKEAMIQALVEMNLGHAAARLQAVLAAPNVIDALVQELENSSLHQPQAQVLSTEALAEACRNPDFAAIVHAQTRAMRTLLVEFLVQAQQRGEVDARLDPEATANILLAIVDGARALPVRNPAVDVQASSAHLRIMLRRFLAPPAATGHTAAPT
ncbi:MULTISPECIES: TetR/AcrR family transcriptional regulator [unclassified Bradyrhizobium]|uniref:TetR/AcrR family transcriptional regulator n=1 Tax=unclassified Bradyrhizobium TaxID=2631580 RepID=UPI0028E18CF8|nr:MULTISPECIES: TetR/AcrR family transcriptional regulator [unclassified Bradyrhizobium]